MYFMLGMVELMALKSGCQYKTKSPLGVYLPMTIYCFLALSFSRT